MSNAAAKRWVVWSRDDFRAVSAATGIPISAFTSAGVDDRCELGCVDAPTKGAAIVLAHQRWPRIPIADLDITEAPSA